MIFLATDPASSDRLSSVPLENGPAAGGPEAWIDVSRIAAALAVVCLHVSAGVVAGAKFASLSWWAGNLFDSATRWSVPVFVMISGVLLLRPEKSESLEAFYGKRLRRIFIPTIFWTGVFTLLAYFAGRAAGAPPSPAYLAVNILLGTPHYHMWFIYMLAGLYLFTPFFRKVLRLSSPREQILLVLLLFAVSLVSYGFEFVYPGVPMAFTNRSILYLPYFFAGYLLAAWKTSLSAGTLAFFVAVSIAFTAAGTYFLNHYFGGSRGYYFYGELSVAVIPMSLSILLFLKNLFSRLRPSPVLRRIASLTFGVYLIHPLFIESLAALGWKAADYPPLLSIPAFALAAFGLSLASAEVLVRIPFLRRTI